MADPDEGVAADGTIRTGARRDRVPAAFEPVLADAVAFASGREASLYTYGSVVTGTARLGSSDVDLLSIDLPQAAALGQRLSVRYADRCRGVEIAATSSADFTGDTDAAYGFRVFSRHYCVHLAGPDPAAELPAFPADARAARGFNGDLGQHLRRWRHLLESGAMAADLLGTRIARKTLLAVAGLVSVHDHTWTTDRSRAARRWSELQPDLAAHLDVLHSWVAAERHPGREEVTRALTEDGIVSAITERFGQLIGLWPDNPDGQLIVARGFGDLHQALPLPHSRRWRQRTGRLPLLDVIVALAVMATCASLTGRELAHDWPLSRRPPRAAARRERCRAQRRRLDLIRLNSAVQQAGKRDESAATRRLLMRARGEAVRTPCI